jgi:hypothetical protein
MYVGRLLVLSTWLLGLGVAVAPYLPRALLHNFQRNLASTFYTMCPWQEAQGGKPGACVGIPSDK